MGQTKSREPGDKTLVYGATPYFMNKYVKSMILENVQDLYARRDEGELEYFYDSVKALLSDKNADDQIKYSENQDALVAIITSRISKAFGQIDDASVITPWEVEKAIGIADLVPLFGEPKTKLEVLVFVDGKKYIHEFTEDLMCGILSVIETTDNSAKFKFYVGRIIGYQMTIFDIAANYISVEKNKRYHATTPIGEISFETIDVIRGIITAANWLNEDPHKFIKDIYDNGTEVTF